MIWLVAPSRCLLLVIRPTCVTRSEQQAGRLVDAIADRIPNVSQQANRTWWNKR